MKEILAEISHRISWPETRIEQFCQKWGVAELSLFGSILREDFNSDSDIDVLIAFSPNSDWGIFDHLTMEQELQTIFDRDVDLVSKRAVLNSENPIRRHNVLSTYRVIYSIG